MTDNPASGKIPRKLNLTPAESKQIIDHIQSNPADLLQIPSVRALLAKSRFERVEAGRSKPWTIPARPCDPTRSSTT